MALLAVVVAAVVVLLADVGNGGRSRPSPPGSDIAAPTDAAALARVVDRALRERGASPGRRPSPDTTCAGEARANYGQGLGPLVYAATLRWQGTAAVLLAYRLEGAGPTGLDHRAFVLSREDCRLLVVQTL